MKALHRNVGLLCVLVGVYSGFMAATNHRLSILDDEAIIITVANSPIAATLHAFLSGYGQHEHPPLSDLVLHGWLVATHFSLAWVRVPAIAFYVAGLLVLAQCGRRLGSSLTAWAVLLLGMLWPFGYFYARIAGWYCFCFLLVSLLTLAYLRLVEQPCPLRWTWFTIAAVLLLWSNYFGVVILLVLLGDLLLFRRSLRRLNLLALLISAGIILLSFVPLLRALLFDARGTVKPAATPVLVVALKLAYVLFALLASVAVAPWFLPMSIPVGIAGLLLLWLLFTNGAARRFAVYFFVLLAALALADHLDLKRLLFLTPWLLLAIAVALTRASRPRTVATLAAITVVFGIGWIGIVTGRHPAIGNFYEPWQQVANETAGEAMDGRTIVSDSTPYFFYLNQAFALQAVPARETYLGEAAYNVRGVSVFQDAFPGSLLPKGKVVAVEGVAAPGKLHDMAATLELLNSRCRLLSSRQSTPDPAAAYKESLGPSIPIMDYRVRVDEFDCSARP